MASHQYRDLPLIPQSMDDTSYPSWGAEYNYMQTHKQHSTHLEPDEEMYSGAFDNGMVMDRFMHDQYPITQGVLHAKIPTQRHFELHYEPQWPSADFYRTVSPDRTSSGNTSQATQNEIRSPHVYHPTTYGCPAEVFSQTTLPYPTIEHFTDGGYLSSTSLDSGSVNLRQLEYEHHEPEYAMEDIESVELKQDAVCEDDAVIVKTNTRRDDRRDSADSGIDVSVRDAESVQPIEVQEDLSSDSDYKPSSTRSSKRRRSTASTGSQSKVSKRRGSQRNNSPGSSPPTSPKVTRKPRGASNTKKIIVEVDDDRRPFPCPFTGYGCTSTFSSKNEWKRHVSTQHIKAGFWRCDLCLPTTDPNDDQTFYYNDFNRKDLFTQHLRRMHAAPKDNPSRSTKEFPVNEVNLIEHQTRCLQSLRTPPQQSGCLFCPKTFAGPSSWEERMEHIGRHLEKDRGSDLNMLDVKAWSEDKPLERYMLVEGLIARENGRWKIGDGKPKRQAGDDSDEDAVED